MTVHSTNGLTAAIEQTDDESRISRRCLTRIRASLAPSDMDVLTLLGEHRFLTSRHVARLAHADATTDLAACRAAQRQLRKLYELRLIGCLPRRVGGWGGGQSQTVWHLTESGQRLLNLDGETGETVAIRRRFREPSPQFLAHTLRVADVRAICEHLSHGKNVGMIQTEPTCWRDWTGTYGTPAILKPDLYVEIADPDYDYYYFVEADLGSEHMPAIARKAAVYQTYRDTGREQARLGGVFPLILWVTPDQRRADQIIATIRDDPTCDKQLHHAVAVADLANYLDGNGSG